MLLVPARKDRKDASRKNLTGLQQRFLSQGHNDHNDEIITQTYDINIVFGTSATWESLRTPRKSLGDPYREVNLGNP